MRTILRKQLFWCLIVFLSVLSCKDKVEPPPVHDGSGVTEAEAHIRPEFLFRITDEEVEHGKANFKSEIGAQSEIGNTKPEINLDYSDFEKTVNQDKKAYAKFFFLLNTDKSLNLGLAISNDSLQNKKDIFYVLKGNKFTLNSAEFEAQKIAFDSFKSKLVNPVSKNDPCDMILYKVNDINNYLKLTKLISGFPGYTIRDLQFDYILFKDFVRKDGTKVDYLRNRESRISFAVKTNFNIIDTKKSLLNDIVNFYYDAGDLKP
ncbi:hypothetical protein ACM40_01780 [Chryseobacterium sp. BLS98]|uniref:hypothetical protein n=1 Tax=Chryseobacterium sp. BLS98 TaxID=885586 RepID=UPI00065ACE1C|nr:hypothetical protein [Chryseobacterium sp. BLS98]KMQ63556.1 hypothetical protein ACM40_01780 [Chryseobacterium sp. BLS98]